MGSEKVALIQKKNDRINATEHLLRDFKALEKMLKRGLFEEDKQRIGVEQEISLVGNDWKPAPVLMHLLDKLKDDHFTTEFAKFNMEVNLDPVDFTGDCFGVIEKDLWKYLSSGEMAALTENAHLLLTGIVPTLLPSDIDLKNCTPLQRYRDLVQALLEMRGDQFEFRIQGEDQWISRAENSFFESSNTSFQVHYQLPVHEFVDSYNWALLISAPVLACSTNSPLLMGKRLWKETRIALFQQSTDVRSSGMAYREKEPRVGFGSNWVKGSMLTYFRENIMRHKAILASTRYEDAVEVLNMGSIPKLYALNIHNGTVYNWNRPCYGITDGKPHIRIENRYLPSGPSIVDEVANAAFWLGLMKGMPDRYKNIYEIMDFGTAKKNFHYAARLGLETTLQWPGYDRAIPVSEIILKELLPIAESGLKAVKVKEKDINKYLGIIKERVESGQTGANWTLKAFEKLTKECSKDEALVAVTAGMSRRQQKGRPVHTWDLPKVEEAGYWQNRYQTIEQIMTTELFTVLEDDPVKLVAQMMKWRNIRHVPVENKKGEFCGVISCKSLLLNDEKKDSAKDIISEHLVPIHPSTQTMEAIQLMKKESVDCLPVLVGKQLVGLVTEKDFIEVAAAYLKLP